MILVDTSIWVEMFRRGRFKTDLEFDRECPALHPSVRSRGISVRVSSRPAANTPRARQLTALPTIRTADVRYMLETRGLFSKGIGFIDAQLIASCITSHGTQIWTIDRPLGSVAESLGLRATP